MHESQHPIPVLGFVGLGVMGEPMCRNLINKTVKGSPACVEVKVFDLQADPIDRLCDLGASRAGSIKELAASVDILFLSLPSGKHVEAAVSGADGVLANANPGTVIVDMSTSPVQLTRDLAAQASDKQLGYVDSPVARTREAAIAGTLAMMVGASDQHFQQVEPFLACMATDILHCGEVGCGQITKILNNMVLFQTVQGLAEALTLARRAGMDGDVLFDAFEKGSADSFALRNHGRKSLLTGSYPSPSFSTHYARKDLSYALQLAVSTQTDVPAAQVLDSVFEKTINAGFGDNYWPALLEVIDSEDS